MNHSNLIKAIESGDTKTADFLFRKSMNRGAKSLKNRASKLEDMVEERIESASTILKENANALLNMNEDHQIKK